jgi:ammonia channel protein AmtB
MIDPATVYTSQVSTSIIVQDVYFAVAVIAVMIAITGLGLIDAGLSRRKNLLDNWVGKIIAGFLSAFGFIFVGYGIWYWQFYSALGSLIPSARLSTIGGWVAPR